MNTVTIQAWAIGIAFLSGVGFDLVLGKALSLVKAWSDMKRYRAALEAMEQDPEGITPHQLRIIDRALYPELNLPPR